MNKRTFKEFLKIKKFIYTSGKVKIKSDVQISEEQVKQICDIIYPILRVAYYRGGYNIARKIVYQLGPPVCSAECSFKRKRIIIKISQYHSSGFR